MTNPDGPQELDGEAGRYRNAAPTPADLLLSGSAQLLRKQLAGALGPLVKEFGGMLPAMAQGVAALAPAYVAEKFQAFADLPAALEQWETEERAAIAAAAASKSPAA